MAATTDEGTIRKIKKKKKKYLREKEEVEQEQQQQQQRQQRSPNAVPNAVRQRGAKGNAQKPSGAGEAQDRPKKKREKRGKWGKKSGGKAKKGTSRTEEPSVIGGREGGRERCGRM